MTELGYLVFELADMLTECISSYVNNVDDVIMSTD